MRKTIFLLMLSAMAVSCSNEELIDNGSISSSIDFQALTSRLTTRAVKETNSVNMKDNSFEVYAFTEKGKMFMGKQLSTADYEVSHGVEIKYKGNAWDYANPADKAFWPAEKLNFYAFHPKQTVAEGYMLEVSSDKKQVMRYAVPTVSDFQTDLMYAISRGVDKTSNSGKVRLLFRHALTQVCFKAKTELGSMSVDIEDLKIHNIGISGDMTLPVSGDVATKDNWKVSGKKRIDYLPKDLKANVVEIGTQPKEILHKLYIPQVLEKWEPEKNNIGQADIAGQSYLSILCRIRQNGVYLWGSENKYMRLFVPFGTKWEPGKRYVYTLVFGGGYDENGNKIVSPIQFEVEEHRWQDTPYDVNTDMNVAID